VSDLKANNYIALFVPLLDIPVRLGRLFHLVALVDDGFDLPRFDQLLDGQQILAAARCNRTDDFLTAIPRSPQHLKKLL
jgi:hypothetical protein